MASSLASHGRSHVVSRAKKTPSPSTLLPKTPNKPETNFKKRLNSSDGSSKRHVTSTSPFRVERSTSSRPSDRLNPKTVDPVSYILLSCVSSLPQNVIHLILYLLQGFCSVFCIFGEHYSKLYL